MLGIAVVLALAAAGGYFYVQRRRAEPPPAGPVLVKMGEFVTNLAGADNRRFVRIQIDMEASSEEAAKELQVKASQVRDQVLMVLRSKTIADLAGPEGMRRLGADLVAGTNKVLANGGISAIYFVEFAIQ
jgi:flagellar FliL protein